MIDAKKLAARIVEAMDNGEKPVSGAVVARACEVTPQAVNGWRKTGRVSKGYLIKLSQLTGKPLAYFLADEIPEYAVAPLTPEAELLAREWMGLTPRYREVVKLSLQQCQATLKQFPELRNEPAEEKKPSHAKSVRKTDVKIKA